MWHSAHVEVREQPWVWFLAFYLVWGSSTYSRLAGLRILVDMPCLCLPCSHKCWDYTYKLPIPALKWDLSSSFQTYMLNTLTCWAVSQPPKRNMLVRVTLIPSSSSLQQPLIYFFSVSICQFHLNKPNPIVAEASFELSKLLCQSSEWLGIWACATRPSST